MRGKWVCRRCETLIQAPMPAQIIDKGIPSAGLLAHVLIAKFADHIPLYRLEGILERSGVRCRAQHWRSGWACAASSWRRSLRR